MKYFLIVYIICNSFIFSIGQQFVEEFENNKNEWYINKSKAEEVYIEKGNYIIKNLDENTGLSLNLTGDITDFFAQEYIWKQIGKENSIYGVYIELDTKDRFYFVFNNDKIAYLYENEGKMGILDDFKKFPYLSPEYNSIVFVKDNNNFTFIINQIPTEKIWTLSSAKIERVGVYIGDLTSLYIDKYTIFRL